MRQRQGVSAAVLVTILLEDVGQFVLWFLSRRVLRNRKHDMLPRTESLVQGDYHLTLQEQETCSRCASTETKVGVS